MGAEEVMNYVLEKLKELLLLIENFGGYLLEKFDELFPADTRGEKIQHWVKVGAPFVITAVVLVVFCYCCRLCCRLCCCRGRRGVRMMKAPGRNYRMPRHVFEANPRSYFQNLRGRDELV